MRRLATVVVALTAMAGCGDTINNFQNDGGGNDAAGTCTPNAKECVTSRVARICAADGSGWVTQQCDLGDICTGGECMLDPNVACNPGDGVCADATHALVCNSNGMGFMSVTCPANTNCAGPGVCEGSCIVGSSFCLDVNTVVTCMNGTTYTSSACTRGSTACVTTGTTPFNTAACMPAQCTPDPNGCDNVCGNKTMGNSNTDPGFLSFCQETGNGYKWAAVQCPSPATCSPGGAACTGTSGGTMATCSSACVAGQSRCTADGLSIQTCSNGNFGNPVNCTMGGAAQQVCIQSGSSAVCGDPVCASSPGACESDGFHPCVNGKVAAAPMACTSGTCVASGAPVGGFTPGSCQSQCNAGDSQCVNATQFQTCSNGLWSSTLMTCAADQCQQTTDAGGNPRTVCGVCTPGTHRCTDNAGTPGGAGSTHIEVCGSNGQWGAATACTTGTCQPPGTPLNNTSDSACEAECVASSKVCVGTAPGSPPNATHPGTIAEVVCNTNGTLPAIPSAAACGGGTPPATCCPTGTSCRKGPGRQPIVSATGNPTGCVQCVGPSITGGNEIGLVDSRCVANATESCQANNTWPGSGMSCGGLTCTAETGTIGGPSCGNCGSFGDCTESNLAGIGGCRNNGIVDLGPPGACGSTTDCCSFTCAPPPAPTPASCQ